MHEIVIGRVKKAIAKGQNQCVTNRVIKLLNAFLRHFDGEVGEIGNGVGHDNGISNDVQFTNKTEAKFERDEDL